MTRLLNLFGSRIKHKLALLSVIPVAVVTVIITWHTIATSTEQIQATQVRIATHLARSLATVADFALYSNREDLLSPLTESAGDRPGIANILFLGPDRAPLLQPSLPDSLTARMLAAGDYRDLAPHLMVIEEPVYLVAVDVTDFDEGAAAERLLLGWVVVVTDNTFARQRAQETIVTHLLISLSVLLGAMLLSFILSHNVVSPIEDITSTVRELEKGNLDARITPSTGDELAILANGINHLAKSVAEARDNLEGKIDVATERLRKTLDDLQQKNLELEEARREAEGASAAKGEFLAHMSHELRTPITAIQGFVNLLTASELQPSQSRYCAIIQQASGQLLQLIDDILDITRLQSNAIVLDNGPFDLAECVETPLSLMAANAHEKGVELVLDMAANVPFRVRGDSLRIRQVIYNLISNAIKFTPSGHVTLNVSARGALGNRMTLVLQVVDTGIGIPDKDQVKLFEAFSQADSSISRRFGGSGLGLSIVKRIVTLMGGTLQLESTAGRGSCFTIEIPVDIQDGEDQVPRGSVSSVLLFDTFAESRQALEHRLSRYVGTIDSCEDFSDLEIDDRRRAPELIFYSAPIDATPPQLEADLIRLRGRFGCPICVLVPATPAFKAMDDAVITRLQPISFMDKPPRSADLAQVCTNFESHRNSGRERLDDHLNARILITDDNEFTRILLATFFEDSQCSLTLAANGQEAIDACGGERFDLVLMDVHMPEVNGLAALQAIRTGAGPNRDTPVIMLTADILQQEERALFDAGASDLLFKPIDERKLLNCVHKHLESTLRDRTLREAGAGSGLLDSDATRRQLFAEEIARLADLARSALTSLDEDALREATHQLLGIAGVYRMTYLERAVKALHKAIMSGDGNKMFAAMETLQHEVGQLRAAAEGEAPRTV